MKLDILNQSCNRCGQCCTKGGACVARQWGAGHGVMRRLTFTGRCELLRDNGDGTTTCTVFEQLDPERLRLSGIVGRCEWPSLRRPLPHETWVLLVVNGNVVDLLGCCVQERDTLPIRRYYDPSLHLGTPTELASSSTGRLYCYAAMDRTQAIG